MELDYKDIGLRIRQRRKSMRYTQQQLAELSDQEPSNISHIERGATKLSLPTLVSIANALGVSADELLCGSIQASKSAFDKEVSQLLEDCTHAERKVIIGTMRSLKEQLRNMQRTGSPTEIH